MKKKRISAQCGRNKRLSLVKKHISSFEPDWISLQYVPYSFHPKGIDLLLPRFFLKLKGKYKWHLMIHEAWISSPERFNKKYFTSLLQKKILKALINILRPVFIHTSNSYYQDTLRNEGVQSQILHLPGNIPIDNSSHSLLKKELSKIGIQVENRNEWLILGLFGRIRPNVSYMSILERISRNSKESGKYIALLTIGNSGPLAEEIFSEVKKHFGNKILIHAFGHRNIAEISAFFQNLDFGIASVPEHLLGKSGAYSAMRNHGLKILIPESRELQEEEINRTAYSGYLLKIKDEDFGSRKVAKIFLSILKSSKIERFESTILNENSIYQS